MVRRDDPASVGLALDDARDFSHRFKPPDMRFGEAFAGGRIVLQMGVDRIAPAVRRRDLVDRPIDGANAAIAWRDPDDGIFWGRVDRLALADLGIMGAPVDAVDQQIMTVFMFVGEPAHHDAADDRRRLLRDRVVDDAIDRSTIELPRGQLALHGADDVAALADLAQCVRKVGLKPPGAVADMRGESHAPEFLQATDAKRLLEGIAIARADQPRGIHVADQPSVDRGQPLGTRIAAKPLFDFKVGARPQVEVDDLDRPLPAPVRGILARDQQILTPIVYAAHHDMRVRMAGIEMVDRHPIELCPKILLHLRHQPAHERLQVGILVGVLGRHDEPELAAVAVTPFEERLAIGVAAVGRVERTSLALTGHAVALNIAKMRLRTAHAFPAKADRPYLDDHAARPERAQSVARSEHPRNTRAAPDPAAVETAAPARFHAGPLCRFHDAAQAALLLAPAAPPAQLRFELIIAHSGVLPCRNAAPRR